MVQTKKGACQNEWIAFMRECGTVYRERRALCDDLKEMVDKARRASEVLGNVEGETFDNLGELLKLLHKLKVADKLADML